MSLRAHAFAAVALAALGGAAQAGPVDVRVSDANGKPMVGVEIAQVGKTFTPAVTVVTVGTAVTFPNRDTVRHHVYSFSPVKKFEIKLYVGTPASPVVFDQPGIGVLGCNIHDSMVAWVVIVETPWFGQTGVDGRWRAPQVPPGHYRLRAWHPSLAVGAPADDQPLRVDTGPTEAVVRLAGATP